MRITAQVAKKKKNYVFFKFNYHLKLKLGPDPCVLLQKKKRKRKFTLCTKLCKARLGFFSSGLRFFFTESIHLKVQNFENYKTWIVVKHIL